MTDGQRQEKAKSTDVVWSTAGVRDGLGEKRKMADGQNKKRES